MNSLRSLGRAIDFEIERQVDLVEAGERVVQETRHWDEADGLTHGMRTKEGSSDYRYFPEPDLVPLAPTDEQRRHAGELLPELPAARRARLVTEWGVAGDAARILVDVDGLADYAEAAVLVLSTGTPRDVTNWCTGEILAYLRETGASPAALPLPPDGLAELVVLVADGTISRSQAKDVLDECLRQPKRPKQVVDERGLAQVSDEGELAAIIEQVIAEHPDEVAAFRSGDEKERKKKSGFLMGEARKASGGRGNMQVLKRLLEEELG